MAEPGTRTRQRDLRRRLDSAADRFDGADYVHRQSCDALFERMAPLLLEPKLILDLGCATGTGSRQLARRFRRARLVCMDLSAAMLARARSRRSRFARLREVRGDAQHLPLADASVDLVFANQLLPWIGDIAECFAEINRVLRKGGLFMFATLGAGSLAALRDAWASVDGDAHVATLPDMHDVGDALLRAGLADPVLDVDTLTVTFSSMERLYADLSACGARNCLAGRRRTLTGRRRFDQMETSLRQGGETSQLSVGLELVFGHAWGAGPRRPAGDFSVEPAAIGRRRR